MKPMKPRKPTASERAASEYGAWYIADSYRSIAEESYRAGVRWARRRVVNVIQKSLFDCWDFTVLDAVKKALK